jgi:hypothetical protein
MPTKKATTKKGTKVPPARRPRNSEGIARVWGDDGDDATPRQNGNGGTKVNTVPRKRNPAPTLEEAALRANQLTLRAWERIYANRGKRLTD